MNVPWTFNANQFEPNQGMGIHPPAQKIPFKISNTAIKETSAKDGSAFLEVEFTSPIGTLFSRYNIKNNSPKAVEIAYGQLSALCRAVNIYQIDGNNECAALRGGSGLMDVGYQKGEEPDPAFPDRKGYTELKRVYDVAGNDPSKAGGSLQQQQPQQQQPQGGSAPLQQQGNGGWTNQPQAGNAAPAQSNQQGGAWQPGGAAQGQTPPWGNRQ